MKAAELYNWDTVISSATLKVCFLQNVNADELQALQMNNSHLLANTKNYEFWISQVKRASGALSDLLCAKRGQQWRCAQETWKFSFSGSRRPTDACPNDVGIFTQQRARQRCLAAATEFSNTFL